MKSKSLIIRTKDWLNHLILPNTVVCDEANRSEDYKIWDVLNDCFISSLVVFFILILPCDAFNWPISIVVGANIIQAILLIDYLVRKDVPRAGKIIAILSLAVNLFLAISLATNRWDWFMGLF